MNYTTLAYILPILPIQFYNTTLSKKVHNKIFIEMFKYMHKINVILVSLFVQLMFLFFHLFFFSQDLFLMLVEDYTFL